MKKVKILKRKYTLLKKYLYIDNTTNLSRKIKTNVHVHCHIRDIQKEPTFNTVTIELKE